MLSDLCTSPAPGPGTSYVDFINSMHLPAELAEVDPIVASFCGGAVGAVSALLVVEVSIAGPSTALASHATHKHGSKQSASQHHVTW